MLAQIIGLMLLLTGCLVWLADFLEKRAEGSLRDSASDLFDWLGVSPENLWQIRTSQKSGREPPEPPLPTLNCHVIRRKWEAINKELRVL